MSTGNPYSQLLRSVLGPEHGAATAFVSQWDGLEVLVVDVFRRGVAEPDDEAEFRMLSRWLATHYPAHRTSLAAYWPVSHVDGTPARRDPFRPLFEVPRAADFVGNWPALQTLPAAREALNRWLIDLAPAPTAHDSP